MRPWRRRSDVSTSRSFRLIGERGASTRTISQSPSGIAPVCIGEGVCFPGAVCRQAGLDPRFGPAQVGHVAEDTVQVILLGRGQFHVRPYCEHRVAGLDGHKGVYDQSGPFSHALVEGHIVPGMARRRRGQPESSGVPTPLPPARAPRAPASSQAGCAAKRRRFPGVSATGRVATPGRLH